MKILDAQSVQMGNLAAPIILAEIETANALIWLRIDDK